MCTPGWSICCVFLTLFMSAGGLETSGNDSQVICPQGLSECTMEDEMYLMAENSVDIHSIKPHFNLCCLDGELCALCLVIDVELLIQPDSDTEDESHLRSDGEDYEPKESVTVCYSTAVTMPVCKKVEFTVNHTAISHRNKVKMTVVITKADGFPFSCQVFVDTGKQTNLYQEVESPSLDEVCSQEPRKHVQQCQVPTVSSVINQEKNQVELQFENRNDTLPSMCVQYEENGSCQEWTRATIPLYFVTPCMCLQLWYGDDWGRHLKLCPFNKPDFSNISQKNMWDNVSVSVRQGIMNNGGTKLSWNVSAPCRLEGEVWPCGGERGCGKANAFRQLLAESQSGGTWNQNNKGHWEKSGVFENIDPQLLPCVMLEIKGVGHKLGPICIYKTGRSHWSLLVIGFMLLVCLMIISSYFFIDFVKKWVWSWRHGGFVKIGRKGHVVLLSPPDVDDGVSESVCQLGSLLSSQGFSVSVDQWSRKEQCTLGPLPWLHSQLLKLDSLGGRILLVLTQKAVERTEEWTPWTNDINKMQGEDKDLSLLWSPYADTFTASLFIMQADKQLGRAGERFLLVTFDSHPTQSHNRDRRLPEPLQGLPLFHLPSQTQPLLTELSVVEAERGSHKKTRTIPTWRTTETWTAKTIKGLNQQSPASCKFLGVVNNHESSPLNYV